MPQEPRLKRRLLLQRQMPLWQALPVALLAATAAGLCAQRFEPHWYVPHPLADAAAAKERIQSLSPKFVPTSSLGNNFFVEDGYFLAHAEATETGLQLEFRKGNAPPKGLKPWSAPVAGAATNSGKGSLPVTIDYREISYLQMWQVRAHGGSDWCVAPVENPGNRNNVVCFAQREQAQSMADALTTLARASGAKTIPPLGMWAQPGISEDPARRQKQSGWVISQLDSEGPPALAGLEVGDLIYRVNGQPSPGSGSFLTAFRTAAQGGDGIEIPVDFLRSGQHLSVVLHYPAAQGAAIRPASATAAASGNEQTNR